jgi:hypothetical protein
LAERLHAIVHGLAVVVANRLRRTPKEALAGPVTLWFMGIVKRFAALATHVRNGRLPRKRPARKSHSGPRPATRPRTFGWLLAEGRHDAAYWRRQLESLLAEPEFGAFLAAAPSAGRLVRPLCHVLALRPALLYPPKPQPHPKPPPSPAAPVAPESEPGPPTRRFLTPDDLPCPRLAATWPWRDLLNPKPA